MIIHKPVFETKDSNAHALHACGRQMMVEETRQTTNFWVCFFYNMFLYWLINLFITITFLYWQIFFRQVKPTKQLSFDPISFITKQFIGLTFLYW